jgi:hypothetical protein
MRVLGVVENMSGLRQPLSELQFWGADGSDATPQVLAALRQALGPEAADGLVAHADVFWASKGAAALRAALHMALRVLLCRCVAVARAACIPAALPNEPKRPHA